MYKYRRFVFAQFFILFFLAALSFSLVRIVQAKDQCPASNGLIKSDTTWSTDQMIDGKYDCSETDLQIDSAILTIETPGSSSRLDSLLDVKSITIRNDGDIRLEIHNDSTLEKFVNIVENVAKDPETVGQVAIGTGFSIQLLSLASLVYGNNASLASLFGVLGQIFFGKRPVKGFFGVVYDSSSFKPIAFAIVHLYNASDNMLLTTTVTDLDGRYGFTVAGGSYYIRVKHENFTFPAKNLSSKILNSKDMAYSGKKFSVSKEINIDFNIPLDPKIRKNSLSGIFKASWMKIKSAARKGNIIFLIILLVLNLMLFLLYREMINLIFLLAYLLLLLLRFISSMKKPRAWGIAYNSETNIPIPSAFIKLYKHQDKQLVDTKITDNKGRFQFFVPQKKYLALVSVLGYRFPSKVSQKENLTFHDSLLEVEAEAGSINIDIPLDPQEGTSHSTSPFS